MAIWDLIQQDKEEWDLDEETSTVINEFFSHRPKCKNADQWPDNTVVDIIDNTQSIYDMNDKILFQKGDLEPEIRCQLRTALETIPITHCPYCGNPIYSDTYSQAVQKLKRQASSIK